MNTVTRDIILLFTTRTIRLFAYGFISVVLALYLAATGLSASGVGAILTATLAGDILVSLWVTMVADRFGRKNMLLLGAALMILAGLVFLLTNDPVWITLAAIIGIVSPSGGEIGPFLSIEQASLSQLVPDSDAPGFSAGTISSVRSPQRPVPWWAAGWRNGCRQSAGVDWRHTDSSWRGYAACGLALIVFFILLSRQAEVVPVVESIGGTAKRTMGLHRSKKVVFKLSSLFALDAFAGGFVVQSMIAWWLHVRYGVDEGMLGTLFFGANLLAGVSALLATRLADRIGLVRTMVYTHIPSNILLCLVPLMPNFWLAIAVLLLRS